MTTTFSPDADRAETAYYEQVAEQWREWCRYLAAHRDLLAARSASSGERSTFEREGVSADERSRQAERTLVALAPARRAIFDAEREARRQQTQAAAERTARASGTTALPDPDTLEREVVALLLAEAHGSADATEGRGLVPMGEGLWYSVDVAALEDAPNAAAYSLRRAEADDRRKRLLLIAAVLLGGLGITVLWFLWPTSRTTTSTATSTVLVDGTPQPSWSVRQLVLEPMEEPPITVPVTATTGVAWPEAPGPYWRSTQAWPVALCVPHAHLADLRAVQLVGDGTQPTRRYTLSPGPAGGVDLVVAACDQPTASMRYGALVATEPLAEQPFTTPVLVNGTPVRVQQITAAGQGDDPTLPDGLVRVTVALSTMLPLDWPALQPTLHLATGDARQPSDVTVDATGAQLHYLVPTFATPVPIQWSLLVSQTTQLHWRATLPVPLSRSAMLRDALRIVEARAEANDGGGVQLRLVIVNRGASPLALHAADVQLTVGGATVPTPDLPDLQAPLAPDEQRAVVLPLTGLDSHQPLVVQLGAERMQLRFPASIAP